ncbi:MAG: ABC-F family ATP-binding cassette domain-containing protein [Bacteroidales bacterium]|nr:ABC-F family ATP-binding cassette domain-containing protein [Bacteroidales bacterium]
MADAILTVENLSKQYGEKLLFDNISFGLTEGQKTALVARNGYGKSTLLNIIAGRELQDEGRVTLRSGVRVAYMDQNPMVGREERVRDFVFAGDNRLLRLAAEYEQAVAAMQLRPSPAAAEELQRCTNNMDAAAAWDFENRVEEVLSRLGITDLERRMSSMSGGEQKKVALARTLIDDVDLLILDEPTNHLDIAMIEWLEDFLSKQRLTLLMVTHDRYFLDRVCHDILELDGAALYPYKGNYDYFLEKKAEREAIARAEVDKARSLYRTELEWMRRMPQARGTKARARIDAFYELEAKAHTRFDEQRPELSVKTQRIGGKILELYNIDKSYDGRKLIDDFSYVFKRGEKIGIVGPNGIGKSTLLDIVTGSVKPDKGRVIVGGTIRFGFYTQSGMSAKDDRRVIDIIKDVADVVELDNGKEMTAHQFLSYFGFDDTTQYNFYGNLSGGERRRLYLLTVLMANPNFLILDEPTNDLDLYTLAILERFLASYKGCLLIVSHDRCFMDNLVDHLFVFEGQGHIRDFHSTYSDYRSSQQQAARQATKQQREEKPHYENAHSDRRRASYSEKKEYETLTADIDSLNTEKKTLERRLSDPTASDADALTRDSVRLGEVLVLLDEKEMRWLELDEIINPN